MPYRPSADPDPFVVLGVSEHSSDETINAAWRRRMRLSHPDHAVDDADRRRRLAKSIELNRAHDILLDPTLKAEAILARRDRGRPASAPASGGARPSARSRPQPPPARGRTYDTWAGARWSSYRAGGHPEARDRWTYTEPQTKAQADVQPEPKPSRLRDLPTPARIVLMTLVVFVECIWAVVSFVAGFFGFHGVRPDFADSDPERWP